MPPRSSRSACCATTSKRLAIVAPPKALGVLRKELHKEVERRIVCTVNKEMSGRPVPDIEALLETARPPATNCRPSRKASRPWYWVRMLDPDPFELSPGMRMRMEPLADGIPVLLIDGIFREPERVRDQALNLAFEPPSDPYPGRIAVPDASNPSLGAFLTRTLDIVEPRLSARAPARARHRAVEPRPQRTWTPVPIFALVYLNIDDRGGTLFFRRTGGPAARPAPGYLTESRDGFVLRGRIEAVFNRLAIYPGFVPHSGDISGDWIRLGERHRSPRLTQRLMFG